MISVAEFAQLVTAIMALSTFVITLVEFIVLHTKVSVIEHQTNTMKDELVKEVRVASIAKGRLLGKDEAEKAIS